MRAGSQTSADSTIMLTPIAQMTCSNKKGSAKLKPNPTTVTSSTISQRPRVSRKRDSVALSLPLAHCRCAETPARNTNVGAHRCVTQRVAYRSAVVRVGSVGSKAKASL